MMQLKRIVAVWPMFVIGLMLMSAGRVSAAAPTANPLLIKKNTLNAWQLKSSTFNGMAVKMTLGQLSDVRTVEVPQHGRFLSLSVEGYVPMGEIGAPALPAYVKIIEIPQGAEPVVEILRDKVETVDLSAYGKDVPLYPMQAPLSKAGAVASTFTYNRLAYAAKGYQAPALVRVQIMGESRGVRLAKLIVSPIEYEPAKNRLRVHTDLEFELRFEGADYNATQAKKRRYCSSGFRVAEEAGVNAPALRLEARKAKAGKVDELPLRYVIVAAPKFQDALQGFIAWKRQLGYDVIEAYTSDERVGQTAESIRAYLKQLYDNATETDPAPTYILLVGDETEIPPFPSRVSSLLYSNHVTDLYFVEYTGDTLPDAHLGRFSATTVEELMPQIHKTMYMSRIAVEAAGFVDTTLLVAGYDENHDLNNAYLNPALRYIQAYAAGESSDVAAIMYPSPKSAFDDDAEDEIIARISAGAGLVFYTGHGLASEWVMPKISTTVLRTKIFNKDKYPMMVGNCCLTGKFNASAPCFGEQLLRSVDKGAVVYIGATNNTYFDEDFYWIVGLTDIAAQGGKEYTYANTGVGAMDRFYHTHGEAYEDWAVTGADIIYRGNMAVSGSGTILDLYYWEVYELFGDPSYRPYKHKPRPTPIECAAEVVVGTTFLSVQTAPYAQLSLNDADGLPVAVVSADAYGLAELPVAALQVGSYRIYGGASGYTDNEKAVEAVEPDGQFVFVESVQLYDGEVPATNGEYGKRYGVSLRIKNLGNKTVNSLRVHLRSDDPYFTAGEDYICLSAIEPGEAVDLDKELFFTIAANVPNLHLVNYAVELTPDDVAEPMEQTFRVLTTASDIHLVDMTIDDATAAHPNGALDPGETVKVVLRLHNAGDAAARAVQTTFTSAQDYLILPQDKADWGTIAAHDTVTREFLLGTEADKARYEAYTVVCQMAADGRVQEVSIHSRIEVGVETFERVGFGLAVVGQTASELKLHFKAIKENQGRLYILNALGENAATLATDLHLAAGESDLTFPVGGLKPGLYVCVFEGADGRSAVKFIKR